MKHILVVDDDKTNLLVAKETLGDVYKITAVTMGVQALKFLENNKCDLILLDINMPGMDGFEVMSKIREIDGAQDIPIIFLTAANDAAIESRCLEEGALDFIAKPFVKQVIKSRISRILELEELRAGLVDKLEKTTQEIIDIRNKGQKDALTGLWNRAYMEQAVNLSLAAINHGALFMIDMDNFKSINDTYGHLAGDNVLRMFADTLVKYSKENDIASRIGGDEFILFVNGDQPETKLAELAQNIITDMTGQLAAGQYDTNCSVSVGIAMSPMDGEDFTGLYNAADKALYHVKLNGKNSYHFYGDAKKIAAERAENTVDLEYIKALMLRSDAGKGTYNLEFENFHHVYNFLRRFVERNSNEIRTVLFTATTPNDRIIDNEELETAMAALERAVYTSLRRSDISSRYSNKQMVVILLDTDQANSKLVVDRILENYKKEYSGSKVSFSYGIAEVGE